MPGTTVVEGIEIAPQELDEAGWTTALGSKRKQPTSTPSYGRQCVTKNVTAGSRMASSPAKRFMKQVTAPLRLPKLPKDQIKIIVRPKGSLDVSKTDIILLAQALTMAAALTEQQTAEDTVCPNKMQNILVISTPHDQNARADARISKIHTKLGVFEVSAYISAPDHTCKGVIRNIDPSFDKGALRRMILDPRNTTVLEVRRIKNTQVVVTLFDGMRGPNTVMCGAALVPCFLYKRQMDVCYACGHVGHRADVCPSSEEEKKKCHGCGKMKSSESQEEKHQCTPKCVACSGPHITGDKTYKQRYQIPFIVRHRRRRRRQMLRKAQMASGDGISISYAQSSVTPAAAYGGSTLRVRSQSRGRSRSRTRTGSGKGGNSSASRSRSRSRSRSQPAKRATWANKVKGSGTAPSMGKNTTTAKRANEEEPTYRRTRGRRSKMGNVLRKSLSNQRCLLTKRDKKLIRKSWRMFCERNPDYGGRIFIGMFTKHPEYLQLFPRFRDKELRALRHDAKFRAHACAVGHQLSAIVECIEDDEVFVELIRKNAANHLPRAGVRPANFESLFTAALEQMVASNRAFMTPATMNAWERLFEIMNTITRNVYDEAAEFSATSQDTSSGDERTSLDPVAAFAELSKTDAADATSGSSTALGLVTTQEAAAGAGASEKLTEERQDSVPGTSKPNTAATAGNVSGITTGLAILGEANSAPLKSAHCDVADSLTPLAPAPAVDAGGTQAPPAAQPGLRGAVRSNKLTQKASLDAPSLDNMKPATM
ncbi:uncharacterized protein [Dermacentor albipictus]|uniref:uncharacterized protein n=1 Tax=Dermacentor albipictus TaxID=60249 RepID=UPI0031FDCBB1